MFADGAGLLPRSGIFPLGRITVKKVMLIAVMFVMPCLASATCNPASFTASGSTSAGTRLSISISGISGCTIILNRLQAVMVNESSVNSFTTSIRFESGACGSTFLWSELLSVTSTQGDALVLPSQDINFGNTQSQGACVEFATTATGIRQSASLVYSYQ